MCLAQSGRGSVRGSNTRRCLGCLENYCYEPTHSLSDSNPDALVMIYIQIDAPGGTLDTLNMVTLGAAAKE